jgi:hypothetical protein
VTHHPVDEGGKYVFENRADYRLICNSDDSEADKYVVLIGVSVRIFTGSVQKHNTTSRLSAEWRCILHIACCEFIGACPAQVRAALRTASNSRPV